MGRHSLHHVAHRPIRVRDVRPTRIDAIRRRRDVPIAIALTMIHQQRRSSLPGGESLEGRARTHVDGEKVGCASDIVDLALVEPREDLGRQIILDELGPVLRTNERSSAPGAARVAQYE